MVRALILAALACLIAVLYQPSSQAQNAVSSGNENQAHWQPPPAAPTAKGRPPAEAYKPACAHPNNQGEESVCAAVRQAEAAEKANDIGRSSLWWSRIGIGVVAATLLAAIAAAVFAERAAYHTNRGATATAAQVALARDTASKELRAYIGVLWAKAYYVGAPLSRVVIEIKNYGKTPAFDVTSKTGFPGKGENGSTVIFAHEFGIVEPGQERIIWINLPEAWISENIEALRAGEVRLFAETKIQYSDVGGVDRFRGFCCYLPRLRNLDGRGDPGVPMTITASGNVDSWVGQWAEVHHIPPLDEGGEG